MERKRKLPARAAARVDQLSKRRTLTPPERRSITPASAQEPEATPVPEPKPPLPRSIQAGKPLPTVEDAQPNDLPDKEYQSIIESGVLSESLSRSRSRWISEGIFEKFWSKPSKRKGVVEDPNNPAKESMTKVGQVVITVEPHVFEATMYVVKDPKPPQPPPPPPPGPTVRPIIQYGPPNGIMPPPPTPSIAASSPPQTPLQPPVQTPKLAAAELATQSQPQPAATTRDASRPPPSTIPAAPNPTASPRGTESVLPPGSAAPSSATPQALHRPIAAATPIPGQPTQPSPSPIPSAATPTPSTTVGAPGRPPGTPLGGTPATRPGVNGAQVTGTAGKPAPGTDPIILTLAEKAGEDPQLRDLMKRVAQGDAAKHELERFQAIIDEITAESKRKGTPQGPSADRLLVDGKTVRYFADEVRTILDIVLASNPKQTSTDLRPPPGSDPLVVLLVKTALDEPRTRDTVRRIAENRPQFSDATDLKAVLDRLKHKVARELERNKTQSPAPSSAPSATPKLNNSTVDGLGTATPTPTSQAVQQPPQQALRSKGPPPPPPKPDISAVVFEFSGGTGDRYLFPKFSILEYVAVPAGQQVIASFLIVRKGSASEYPVADPALDYYQPVTIRLFTPTGRHLEHLARVVGPQEEVRRYMDDIMDRMTRAEYVLLAMRLPRAEPATKEDGAATPAAAGLSLDDKGPGARTGRAPSRPSEVEVEVVGAPPPQPSVLWAMKPLRPDNKELMPRTKLGGKVLDEDEQYQKFIADVSRKEPEEA
ncbi:hypothetical protein QBC33DRAFT_292667 [Phialemonium atrogriseum]|uniref:SWR1-complex protein 3 domain-containing protein n=1 Tax=Phialemonium atrogriseum TaxID=1093897 RepID=A0AAJ0FCG6_9PEZI|nr:uncharacterized protein QBC33DRAFT_292667 [Phialemonium atrogriseum]KAK1762102.1 hypothetical protein QBC33DRAFT_292667 [Phialemonium atrogriseum]